MTETNTYTIPTPAPQAPAPKKRAWWKKPAILVGAAAFIFGSIIGSAGEPEPVEIVKEVPGPERVVTKNVEVQKTPAACLEALTLSETAFDYAAEALGYTNDALQAAGNMDVATINAAAADLKVLNPKISAIAPRVDAAKAECRAAN